MRAPFIVGYLIAAGLLLISLLRSNGEFIIYAVIAVAMIVLLHKTNASLNYHPLPLWGINLWLVLHTLGGLWQVNGSALYATVLIPFVGEPYQILKYDQILHLFFYMIAALLVYAAAFKATGGKHTMIATVLTVLAAAGIGGANEIIEFIAVVVLPETGVGGYHNTAIDLVANQLGAIAAIPLFKVFYKNNNKKKNSK